MENRIIKFRYWNDISKVMVNNPQMPYKEGWTIEQLFSDRGWIWMQFTGLKDKNGKEIYEGDIVKNDRGQHFDILWQGDCWIMRYENENTAKYRMTELSELEVVGNIYENPELIIKLTYKIYE
jgi:hypothetical protein